MRQLRASRAPNASPAGIQRAACASILLSALITGLCGPAPSSAAQETVAIINSHYKPTPLTVAVGDTVTWINEGFILHNVTAMNGEFASGTLHGGQKFSVKFTKPGTFDYMCTIHPQMSGTVIVSGQAASHSGSEIGESPAPSPQPSTPAGTAQVSVRVVRDHRRKTRVLISSDRPRGQVLLQLYSREHFAWIQVAHATLNGSGGALFTLRGRLHREVRAVVLGDSGEGPSISSVLRS